MALDYDVKGKFLDALAEVFGVDVIPAFLGEPSPIKISRNKISRTKKDYTIKVDAEDVRIHFFIGHDGVLVFNKTNIVMGKNICTTVFANGKVKRLKQAWNEAGQELLGEPRTAIFYSRYLARARLKKLALKILPVFWANDF